MHNESLIVDDFDVRAVPFIHSVIDLHVVFSPLFEVFEGSVWINIFVVGSVQLDVANVLLNELRSGQ